MEPDILDDIREIEKLHRKLQVAGSPYDARKRYAECLRAGLAAWNEGRSCIYTDDVKAAEAFRDNGTWSDRLNKYCNIVMGCQGWGLFCEDGGPKGCDLIDFWEQIDKKLLHDVEAEAFLVATIRLAGYDGDIWGMEDEWKSMRAALDMDEVSEVFIEASHNAREQVERESAAALSAPLLPKSEPAADPPSPPRRAIGSRKELIREAVRMIRAAPTAAAGYAQVMETFKEERERFGIWPNEGALKQWYQRMRRKVGRAASVRGSLAGA